MTTLKPTKAFWTVHRHVDENNGNVNYALAFSSTSQSESEAISDIEEFLPKAVKGDYPKTPSNWPEPDLEEIKYYSDEADDLTLAFFKASGFQLTSSDPQWNIYHKQTSEIILAKKDDTADSSLELEDLSDANRNAKLTLLAGLLCIEPAKSDVPTKVKYWDPETLRGITKDFAGAFAWWEFD